jgi:hypothetical protein
MLVSSPDYHRKAVYWLGGYVDQSNQLVWKDQLPFKFSGDDLNSFVCSFCVFEVLKRQKCFTFGGRGERTKVKAFD